MSQIDIFGNIILENPDNNTNTKEGLIIIENGEYIFYPNFFSKSESDMLLKSLRVLPFNHFLGQMKS